MGFFFVSFDPLRGLRVAVVSVSIVLTAGCGTPSPLANTCESPEAVARAVLEAIQARDRARLDGLALSQQEFKDHVWPSLPAARPERNLPFSYVWGDLQQKSGLSLSSMLHAHGGHRYDLVGVSFEDVTPYAGYRVHRKATFRVRNAAGTDAEVRVIGSMIEKDGGWKVFSYVVN